MSRYTADEVEAIRDSIFVIMDDFLSTPMIGDAEALELIAEDAGIHKRDLQTYFSDADGMPDGTIRRVRHDLEEQLANASGPQVLDYARDMGIIP